MKSRVVVRSFYEDAYLDFFITYYLAIGFDEIYILKADMDDEYKLPEYKLPSYLTDELKKKVSIFKVKNTGNYILHDNYDKFKDDTVDWVLNIDCDEFLILDWCKYSGGINEYLEEYLNKVVNLGLVDNKKQIQQIKYRWLCITKMDNNINKNNTIIEYINNYPMEIYKYVKSFGATEHMVSKSDKNIKNGYINCHFYINNPINNELIKSNNVNINTKKYIWLLDNQYCKINNSNPKTFRKDKQLCLDGFILHINTRTLTNALTKCLTTQLRTNKKIKNLEEFVLWINNIDINEINKYLINKDIYDDKINIIKSKFNYYLNSKYFFPKKIHKFHASLKQYINIDEILNLTLLKCFYSPLLCNKELNLSTLNFVNLELENKILKQLCDDKNINYEKCIKIMLLY